MGLEFLEDRQILRDISQDGGSTVETASAEHETTTHASDGDGGFGATSAADAMRVAETVASSDDNDNGGTNDADDTDDDCNRPRVETGGGGGDGRNGNGDDTSVADMQLHSSAPDATVVLRTRRSVPVVSSSGQPVMTTATKNPTTAGTTIEPTEGAPKTARGGKAAAGCKDNTSNSDLLSEENQKLSAPEPSGRLEAEASRVETQDMIIHVYWEGAARDRAYVEACPVKDKGRGAKGSAIRRCLRLGVRVPTIAIVDAQAAANFAERVVQQIAIQVGDETLRGGKGRGKKQQQQKRQRQQQQQEQRQGMRLRLSGVDAKTVLVAD